MDILRKMFKTNRDASSELETRDKDAMTKNQFRKPQWFEEVETDDELFDDDRKFAFEIFTNPLELQKHFEHQLQQVLDALGEFEDNGEQPINKNLKEEFLKPGFEQGTNLLKEFEKQQKTFVDTDLDGEIYADQLHSLIKGMKKNVEEPLPNMLPRNDKLNGGQGKVLKPKLSDEERIMCMIHGTWKDDTVKDKKTRPPRMRPDMMTPMTPMLPRNNNGNSGGGGGGVFEGVYQGPKMFSQSVMMKTIRKADGSLETTKVTQDSQGNRTTTVTRTVDGKSETITNHDGAIAKNENDMGTVPRAQVDDVGDYSVRNLYVTKEGYAMPRNLW